MVRRWPPIALGCKVLCRCILTRPLHSRGSPLLASTLDVEMSPRRRRDHSDLSDLYLLARQCVLVLLN